MAAGASTAPTVVSLNNDVVPHGAASSITANGTNLSGVTAKIDGVSATVSASTSTTATVTTPNTLSLGMHTLTLTNGSGSATFQFEAWSESDGVMTGIFQDYNSANSVWSGIASAGTSGANSFDAVNTTWPATSTTLNGHTGMLFDGTKYAADSHHFQSAYFGQDPYIASHGQVIFRCTAALTTDPGSQLRYQAPNLWGTPSGAFGMSIHTGGLTLFAYDGTKYGEATIPNVTINAIHIVQWEITERLIRIRVDGGAWYSDTWNATSGQPNLESRDMKIGSGYGSAYFTGTIWHYSIGSGQQGAHMMLKNLAYLCQVYGFTGPYNTQTPVLETPTNASVGPGDTVTIPGRGLANASAVTLSTLGAVTITSQSATHVSFTMPAGATPGTSYTVTVVTPTASPTTTVKCWQPTVLTNLIMWKRADLGVTTSSGKATAWTDQAGTGDANRNLILRGGDAPAYNATDSLANGKATIGPFNITGSFADCAFKTGGAWTTTYNGDGSGNAITDLVVGLYDPSAPSGYFTFANSDYQAINAQAGAITVYAGDATPLIQDGHATAVAKAQSSTQMAVFQAIFNGTASKLAVDNLDAPGVIGTLTTTGTTTHTNYGVGVMYMGSYPGTATTYGVKRIAERITLSRVLTTAEQADLRSYLNSRYAKQLAA